MMTPHRPPPPTDTHAQQKGKTLFDADKQSLDVQALLREDFSTVPDPNKEIASLDTPNPSIIVRSDFMNEGAWRSFGAMLSEGKRDFLADTPSVNPVTLDAAQHPLIMFVGAQGAGDDIQMEDIESNVEDEERLVFFTIFDADDPQQRAQLTAISNLAALCLPTKTRLRI